MERVIDLNKPPIVNRKYLVRCIETIGFKYEKTYMLPVIGDFHTDQEIIGFPDEHIHIDWRFLSRSDWSDFSNNGLGADLVYSAVISRQYVVGETEKVLRCNRDFPPFPLQIPEHHIEWFPHLEKFYCTSSSMPDVDASQERCPHRGTKLSSVACNKHGIKVCPAHGLQWNSKGNLVPQVFCENPFS
ncbi:Rieske 2Fe-2S domain-containing protein [Microcoleus sp. A006_D1]|uniref:Rieske 2Fe-2S domain-containing protein n=1 Tax=Microcoleus sp. A006_D1 TaxID=3055267 RepID=UPI002FD070D8